MQDKIKQLKDRIYKYNPLLLELSFGCEVAIPTKQTTPHMYKFKLLNTPHLVSDGKLWDGQMVIREVDMSTLKYDLSKVEVIGHPLHLEHVMRAIQESEFNCVYYPAITGNEMKLNICANGKEVNYSLTKSFDQNISDNPELVEFLLEVITK